ncbi:MAG TPA: family 78 glycoside hydrolase catalytic domain, partial [Acidobacteriaceae bacterium]
MRTWSLLAVFASSVVLSTPAILFAANAGVSGAPEKLRTDDLATPLGLDNKAPHFGWQLHDMRRGAKQTAYEILVATKRELLAPGKADAWDSGSVKSGQSVGVVYGGKALEPSTRYFWRVLASDAEGKSYPAAESWWETGLLGQENWRGKWIGYERWEESAVRKAGAVWVTTPDRAELKSMKPNPQKVAEQHIAYRLPFDLKAPVKQAFLFVTGFDVASAWVNGQQVTQGEPLPGWKQFPWKKYKQMDVTKQVKDGQNLLAVEITHYVVNPNGMANEDTPPMSAVLVVQHADGSVEHFESGANGDWKASVHAGAGWESATNADASFKPVIAFVASPGGDGPPGNPWPTQTVKALRGDFEVHKPVASARLYVTALGAYQAFVNGKRAGDDVLSPGWTDYRLRLKYQTYDVTADVKQGHNALATLVAPGWYSTPLMWFQQPNVFGTTAPSLMAQMRIQYRDGSVDWVVSDGHWKAEQSPILKSEIYDGESQDMRLTQAGWNTADFNEQSWKPVDVRSPDMSNIKVDGQDFQPIRVERMLTPKGVTEPKPGVYIFDMGQNFSGVERLRLAGAAGTDVQVRTGEILNADGTLYTDNLRTAKSTDHFTLAGKGMEELE